MSAADEPLYSTNQTDRALVTTRLAPAPDGQHALDRALVASLNPAGALREDLAAAHAARAGETQTSDPLPLERHAGAWFPVVNTLYHAVQLDPDRRPTYLHATAPLWTAAAELLGDLRYATVGAQMTAWPPSAPDLGAVQSVLWALEQVESYGGVHLAVRGLDDLEHLLPARTQAAGYVIAQSGRPLRTIGAVDLAITRYQIAWALGVRHRDSWLQARSQLGLGASYHQRGNYPEAYAAYDAAMQLSPDNSLLRSGAHHGLVLCAIAASDYDSGFAHGWQAFKARHSGPWARADMLGLLSGLCRRIGRPRAAMRAAEAALVVTDLVRHRTALYRIALHAAIALDEPVGVARYMRHLRSHLGIGAGPFEDARGWLALADAYEHLREPEHVEDAVSHAVALSTRYGYHEITFAAEALTQRVREPAPRYEGSGRAVDQAVRRPPASAVTDSGQLTSESWDVIQHITQLPTEREALLSI